MPREQKLCLPTRWTPPSLPLRPAVYLYPLLCLSQCDKLENMSKCFPAEKRVTGTLVYCWRVREVGTDLWLSPQPVGSALTPGREGQIRTEFWDTQLVAGSRSLCGRPALEVRVKGNGEVS